MRILILSSSFTLILWAYVEEEGKIDILIWSGLLFITSLILVVPLVVKQLPTSLSEDEQNLYDAIFAKNFSKHKFKKFYDACISKKEVWTPNTQITKEGNKIKSLIIFSTLKSEQAQVNLYHKEQLVHSLEDWSILGIFEYLDSFNPSLTQNLNARKWYEATCIIDNLRPCSGLIYYEVSLKQLDIFYTSLKDRAMQYRNAFQALIIDNLSIMLANKENLSANTKLKEPISFARPPDSEQLFDVIT